jgi:lysophospholipase L1-like esterase
VVELSVQVSYKKQVTLGIIGIVILLLAIEGVANVWWVAQSNCEFEQNEIFQNFGEVEKRQLCLDFYNIQILGDEIIPNQSTESITINSIGFRGPEFSEMKSPDTYRIFMVGGSTMFGAGATSDETTIPGYLQNLLNEKDFEFNIEVINSGIQGADSNSELKLIKQKLVHYHPDLVIVYDGWNDLRANNASIEVKENWETMCNFSEENNFDVIVTLQPIAGFGSKVLTKQELEYANIGKNYANNPLIQSSSIYLDYGKVLSAIKTCTKTLDLRDAFDDINGPIYWDQGHVSDRGNSIIAKSLLNVVSSIASENYEFSVFETEKNIKKTSSIYNNREIVVAVELMFSLKILMIFMS